MSTISLGNLSVDDLERVTGWEFEKEDKDWLLEHRTSTASFKEKDKYHIFDIPKSITVGVDIQDKLVEILQKYNKIKSPETGIGIYPSQN